MDVTYKHLELIDALGKEYQKAHSEINEEDDKDDIMEASNDFLKFVIDVIPKFFSAANAGEDIRKIYRLLKEGAPETNRTLKVIDIWFASSNYMDYKKGLENFISLINGDNAERTDSEGESLHDKIDKIVNKSSSFVHGLFTDELNKTSDVNVDAAMKEIEFLIGFRKDIEDLIKDNEKMNERLHMDKSYEERIAKLYYSSVTDYVYNVTVNIFVIFTRISDTISGKQTGEEKPRYQMF